MNSIRAKLSVMMFLEFFIWGAWLPLIFGYLPSLGFNAMQQSWVLNAFAIASFVGMFFSNQFADRNFSAEKFLAVSHLVGGVAILALGWTTSFWPFFLLMLVHCLFYVPTISITNAVAFANLKDPQHEFGPVRLWGTIGWIAASWPFVFILVDWAAVPSLSEAGFTSWFGAVLGTPKSGAALQEGVTWTFITAGVSSIVLGVFSLSLPHTPPKPAQPGGETFAWVGAMKLLAVPYVFVLFVVTFFDSAVHQCYFIFTNDFLKSTGVAANWVMPVMSIGQVAEIGTMALLGMCLKKLGWRNIMVIGILGHTLRFGVFALAPMQSLSIAVIMVHGVCYAFFFATVYIFVDEFLPKDSRSSAQGLFNFLILGVGPFVANFIWPYVGEVTKPCHVSAEVRKGAVVVEGKIQNLAAGDGKFSLTMTREGETDGVTREVELSPDQTFKLEMGEAVGNTKYSFSPISVLKRQMFVGDEKVELQLPPLAVPDTMLLAAADAAKGALEQVDKQAAEAMPALVEAKVSASQYDFQKLFLYPSATALLAAIGLFLFFRPPVSSNEASGGPAITPH